METE
jgi:hypothetical protein